MDFGVVKRCFYLPVAADDNVSVNIEVRPLVFCVYNCHKCKNNFNSFFKSYSYAVF